MNVPDDLETPAAKPDSVPPRIEDIRPDMSHQEKQRALQEILRVLREERE